MGDEATRTSKEWIATRQIPGYGTLQGDHPVSERNQWLHRGSVWGLLQFQATEYGGYIFLALNMCTVIIFGQMDIDKHFSCKVGEHIHSITGSIVCEYTKSYVWILPLVLGTTMLLLVGRDLVHKRLYYYLLKFGGVLSFMSPPPLRDILMLGNMFVASQFWLFVLFVSAILYTKGVDPNVAADRVARATAASASNRGVPSYKTWSSYGEDPDSDILALLIHLLVFIGIPGMFVIVKLWSAFDLERTLVPLSEFIRDSLDAELSGTIEADAGGIQDQEFQEDDSVDEDVPGMNFDDLSKLVSIRDNYLKEFLDKDLDRLVTQFDKRSKRYEDIILSYPKFVHKRARRGSRSSKSEAEIEAGQNIEKEPPKLHFCDALWPAPFLMASPHSDRRLFTRVWIAYRTIAMVLVLSACVFTAYRFFSDAKKGLEERHHQNFVRLPGIAFALYLECLISRAFWNSRAYLKHMPVPTFVRDTACFDSFVRKMSSI